MCLSKLGLVASLSCFLLVCCYSTADVGEEEEEEVAEIEEEEEEVEGDTTSTDEDIFSSDDEFDPVFDDTAPAAAPVHDVFATPAPSAVLVAEDAAVFDDADPKSDVAL